MEEVFARLKLLDRTVLITKPIAYLGRSGSQFDGSFQEYVLSEGIQDLNFVQFLPISQDQSIPQVAAKIQFDFLTLDFAIQSCSEKGSVVADGLLLDCSLPSMNYVHLVHQSIIIIQENIAHFQITSFANLYINKLKITLFPPVEKRIAGKDKKPEDIFEQQHKMMRGAFNANDVVAQICETVVPPLVARIPPFGGHLPGVGLSARKNVKIFSEYIIKNRSLFEESQELKRHLKIKEKQKQRAKKADKNSRIPPFHKDVSLYVALQHFFEAEGESNPAAEQKQIPAPGAVIQLKKRGRPKKTQVQETRVMSVFEKRKHSVFIKKSKKRS